MKLPVKQENRHRPAVHRRGRPAGARGRLSVAEGAARLASAREAQVDLYGQAAGDGQCAHRAAAHDVLADDRSDRTARVDRAQSAEHTGAHDRRPPHPRGVHRAARAHARLGRLLAGRASHHGAPVGRPGAAQGVSRRRRHPSRDRGGNLQRAAVRCLRRSAALHQGGQFRPDLRNERIRPGHATQHRAQRRAAIHRSLFRAVPRRGRVHAAHARARARAGLRGNGVRPAAVPARHPCRERAAPRRRPSAQRSMHRCRGPLPT